MNVLRLVAVSVLGTSLTIFIAGCGKEQTAPPKAPETATAPSPAAPAAGATSGAASSTTTATAGDPGALDLANKSGCLVCHAADKKVIGPSYKEVAQKYAGQSDAETTLFNSVKNGSQGKWGAMPMPPNAAVKDDDIRTLVRWVLSFK